MTAGRRQVAPLGVGRPDADRLVGQPHGQRVAVGLAVDDDRLDAERPAGAQDRAAAISPRLAIRIFWNIRRPPHRRPARPSRRRPGRRLGRRPAALDSSSTQTSSWPYSTASPGSTRLAPTMPSAGATTSVGTPSTSIAADRVPGPDPRAGHDARARLEEPDGRRGGDGPERVAARARRDAPTGRHPSRGRGAGRRPAVASPSSPAWFAPRPGPTGVSVGRAGRCRALRAGRRGAALRPGGAVGRAAQADLPAAFADLDLAEAARAELGDQGRDELVSQGVDGGVIGQPGGGIALLGSHRHSSSSAAGSSGAGASGSARGRTGAVTPAERGPPMRFRSRSARPGRSGGGTSTVVIVANGPSER